MKITQHSRLRDKIIIEIENPDQFFLVFKVYLFRFSTPGNWYFMVHGKIGRIKFFITVIAFPRLNLPSPPGWISQFPGLFLFPGNISLIIQKTKIFIPKSNFTLLAHYIPVKHEFDISGFVDFKKLHDFVNDYWILLAQGIIFT